MAEKLAKFLHNGLIHIHDITENIDLKKTSPEYLKKQLPPNISNSYLQIQYSKKNPENIDETFFSFLKSNDKFFSEMKIINLDEKEESLKSHLDEYFKTMHSKYNQDKLFYFYFPYILSLLFFLYMSIIIPLE
jgi:hypothetical protein